jgi:hypothetical protein
MVDHVNFYENLKEARMRLVHTVVVYDGKPFYVLAISNHKSDGVFRIYLDEIGRDKMLAHQRIPVPYEGYDEGGASVGDKMDEWMEKYPDEGIIRKQMDSPKFSKFRPFALGMCNLNGGVVYVERTPIRHTQQGLTSNMLNYHKVGNPPGALLNGRDIPSLTGLPFYRTVVGDYPTVEECLKNLHDPDVTNSAIAFTRNFAFLRGPVDLMFLAYKSDTVGYMPHGDASKLTLSKKFKHTKEVIEDLNLFHDIKVV